MTERADEGRRVARNVASFGAFAMSPLLLLLMIRALGPGGYGRWWWTFVVLEAAAILGMLAGDLYVRREVSRLARRVGTEAEMAAVVGGSLAVLLVTGLSVGGLLLMLAPTLASVQGDSELRTFLLVFAFLPVLWNLAALLTAALQSRDVLGSTAVLRGLVHPLLQAGVLFFCWQTRQPTTVVLLALLGASIAAAGSLVVLYAMHFSLRQTLAATLRPRVRPALAYGTALLLPIALFTLSGKIDLYVLAAYVDPVEVGVYAACLQLAAGLPNTRALLDPVIQTQVGALAAAEPGALAESLRRLTRVCAFVLAPGFVLLIAIGMPVLGFLVGGPVATAAQPLVLLSVGQLVGSMAVASWVVPMLMPGRLLAVIAFVTLAVKGLLLIVLVPPFGATGAAIAAAAGTVVATQGQALFGARRAGYRPYGGNLLALLAITIGVAAGGRLLFALIEPRLDAWLAVAAVGTSCLLVLGMLFLATLEPDERRTLRQKLGLEAAG